MRATSVRPIRAMMLLAVLNRTTSGPFPPLVPAWSPCCCASGSGPIGLCGLPNHMFAGPNAGLLVDVQRVVHSLWFHSTW
eukprot:10210069-Alexandrium_andersonii.AAC.1